MYSIAEQISYHQASTFKLTRGLYLGYLKMQSSVDLIQIVVPSKTPNVLPHSKIRDNPHVSSEEWEFLKKKPPSSLEFRPHNTGPTEVQQIFLESLTSSAHRLFKYMDIPIEEAINHRLYDIEVIELNPDVSFLIICPPAELSCAVPGQREILLQRGDLLSLSVQAFEMIHLRTYQNSIIQKYSRLSCILELDTVLANHSHREAFSSTEVQLAKERLVKLQELTSNLNAVWKGVRWLMDVIGFARDRSCVPGIDMKNILDYKSKMAVEEDAEEINGKRQLLQPPSRDNKLVKASPGRGSWPGPAVNLIGNNGILGAEHSKSDQHLSLGGNLSSRFLSATSGFENSSSRKNSADSNYSNSGHSFYSASDNCGEHILPRLPPSRSEDTLNSVKKLSGHHHQSHRKRSTTMTASLSAASSPLMNVRSSTSYATATESVHSLSSDSESASCPITALSPSKHPHRVKPSTLAESKSMSNVHGGKHFDKKLDRVEVSNTLHIHESESEDKRQTGGRPGLMGGAATATTDAATSSSNPSSIIQVYAAYETGLAFGTSLKLRVYTTTTAREVIDLVVKQLNMAVVLKGKEGPIYTSDKLDDFCLVAVIGARERCLRDDFRPLQLQNPWIKGRLYVRQKHDVLAAIEHSNRDAQLI